MDLKRLHYFCTIVEQGQISRAARLLHMSQPPLSQRLKELEDDLGVQLIIREGHAWQVTEAGRVLYDRARAILNQLSDIPTEVKQAEGGAGGVLRIGASSTCVSRLLRVLPKLTQRFPKLRYSLLITDSGDLEAHVLERDLDFALLLMPVKTDACVTHVMPVDNFSVILPPELARPGLPTCLGVEHLADMPIACLRRWQGGGTYDLLLKEFQRKHIQPNIILDTPDVRTLIASLDRGLRAAFLLPTDEVPFEIARRYAVHAIDLPEVVFHPVLIHLRDRYLSRAAQEVIRSVVEG
ncbi:LysR family transcriptional regulator [Mesoterricola sediminis]|uniref:HTH-type transcriptional regulator BsdA n=1 Tax=Mesoterricola sediminis TaxID=2927980 RepID=A0AA48KDC4_9BACT|nr:LysR family transcriptional regulator [Mesoterricola sediminis]BDU78139.1 HTH-type transcriptional regulator BsdA [Mesoterricola sediminis]